MMGLENNSISFEEAELSAAVTEKGHVGLLQKSCAGGCEDGKEVLAFTRMADIRVNAHSVLDKSEENAVALSNSEMDCGKQTEKEWTAYGKVMLALTCYVGCSIMAVFVTRNLVVGSIPVPIFLSWSQQIVGIIFYQILSRWFLLMNMLRRSFSQQNESISTEEKTFDLEAQEAEKDILSERKNLEDEVIAEHRGPTHFPIIKLNLQILRDILPLSIWFVLMVGFSNSCLLHVQISAYQVARSLTLIFSLFLTVYRLKQKVSVGAILSCVAVASGFCFMMADDSALSLVGAALGTVSSFSQAFYSIKLKESLELYRQKYTSAQVMNGSKTYTEAENFVHSKQVDSNHPYSTISTTSESVHTACDIDFELEERTLSINNSPCAASADDQTSVSSITVHHSDVRHREQKMIRKMGKTQTEQHGVAGSSYTLHSDGLGVEGVCQYYNMVNAALLFPLMSLVFGEANAVREVLFYPKDGFTGILVLLGGIITSGCLTFFLAMSIFWIVSLTSPLAMTISGYVKTLLQTAVAVVVLGESLTPVATLGFFLTLGGSIAYSVDTCYQKVSSASSAR